MILVEAAIETLQAALAAEAAGADRLELCGTLAVDGLTPAVAVVRSVVGSVDIPVFAIVRPRPGGFVYDAEEIRTMLRDIAAAARAGLSGVVCGALTPAGVVDAAATRAMVDAADGLPVTFHRAFDAVRDPPTTLEVLIDAGVARVLTSGCAPTALEGAETIAALVRQARDRIHVVAGGGVRAHNVRDILARTRVREVHARFVDRDGMRQLIEAVRRET
jgi:copper homeostasis protein